MTSEIKNEDARRKCFEMPSVYNQSWFGASTEKGLSLYSSGSMRTGLNVLSRAGTYYKQGSGSAK